MSPSDYYFRPGWAKPGARETKQKMSKAPNEYEAFTARSNRSAYHALSCLMHTGGRLWAEDSFAVRWEVER